MLLEAEHERCDQRELPGCSPAPVPAAPAGLADQGEDDDGGAEREPERQVCHVRMPGVGEQVRALIGVRRDQPVGEHMRTCDPATASDTVNSQRNTRERIGAVYVGGAVRGVRWSGYRLTSPRRRG